MDRPKMGGPQDSLREAPEIQETPAEAIDTEWVAFQRLGPEMRSEYTHQCNQDWGPSRKARV